jgi:hypothetical protein
MYNKKIQGSFAACILFVVTLSFGIAGKSLADSKQAPDMSKTPPMSREEQIAHHGKMIEAHTKMVECLKSEKAIDECHHDMMQACEAANGGTCPMMNHGMMGKEGMHHGMGHKMKSGEAAAKKPAANKSVPPPAPVK